MKLITLTRGLFAIVDDADFDWLNRWNWQAMKSGDKFYASRDVRFGPRRLSQKRRILMHREILRAGPDQLVDHRDRDGLNNTRSNLRCATNTQNGANSISKRGSSQFKGVFWDNQVQRWHARITVGKRQHFLGRFDNELEAAAAYDAAARVYFGEFARPNFSEIAA